MHSTPRRITRSIALLLAVVASRAEAQNLPGPDDTRHGNLRWAMLGLLSAQASVSDAEARHQCLILPVLQPSEPEGPHGDSLLSARCAVAAYRVAGPGALAGWFTAKYTWTSVFTAQDSSRGSTARDTVIEEESVVFVTRGAGQVRAVWHTRYESDMAGVWRSITPVVTEPAGRSAVLSVESCVNGTGGCSQEFLQQYPDGHWTGVWQVWLDQLPPGYVMNRIRHGVQIDPRTLRGKAGFYDDGDPNCCPSSMLNVTLLLKGDSLVLQRQTVVRDTTRK